MTLLKQCEQENPDSFNSGLDKFEHIESAIDWTCNLGGPLPSPIALNE